MKGFQFARLVSVLVLGFCFALPAHAFDPRQFNWDFFGDDFVMNKDKFRGDWNGGDKWDGFLCDGNYHVAADLNGRVGDLQFKLREDQSMDVTSDLRDITVGLKGDYTSELSACQQIAISHSLAIDRVDVAAHVTFKDKGENVPPEIHIAIEKTYFGQVTYSTWLPNWFQDILTGNLNAALDAIWSSSLGERINDFISEQLQKKIPRR